MKRSLSVLIAVVMMLFGSPMPRALADSSAEVLVNILLRKGIISQDEAAEVLGEMEQVQSETAKKIKKIPGKGTLVSGNLGKKHKISGYIQGDAYFGDSVLRSPDNTFDIRRARFKLSGEIIDDLKYKLQVDARDNDDILRDAAISFTSIDWLNLHVGQYKSPFGREELTSSSKIDTMERSAVTNAIAPTRQVGTSVSGDLFDGFLWYHAGIFNGNGINTRNDDNNFLYVGRVVLTPFEGKLMDQDAKFEVGGNIGTSEDSDVNLSRLGFRDFVGERDIYGLDALFTAGPLKVQGEYLKAELEFDGLAGAAAVPATFTPAVAAVPAADVDADGYYILGRYELLPDQLEAVAKWEEFNLDGGADFDALTLGLNYYFSKKTRLMVNYVHGDLEGSSEEDQVLLRMQVAY